MDELKAMQSIDEILKQVSDSHVKDRVLNWIWDKHASSNLRSSRTPDTQKPAKNVSGSTKKRKGRKKPSRSKPKLLGNLNLRPAKGKGFAEFAQEKSPSSQNQKNTVSVYYLQMELGIEAITVDHVYTCYKEAGWKFPSNIGNSLQVTSSEEAWIETKNMDDIQITPAGQNLVLHDLPNKKKE